MHFPRPRRSPGTTVLQRWKYSGMPRNQLCQDPAWEMCDVVDFLVEIHFAQCRVRSRCPLGGADRKDEAGRNEERRPHLRPVRTIVIAADFQTHWDSIGEATANI